MSEAPAARTRRTTRVAATLLQVAALAAVATVVVLALAPAGHHRAEAATTRPLQQAPSVTAVREWLADMQAAAPAVVAGDKADALAKGLRSCADADDTSLTGAQRLDRVATRFGVDRATAADVYEVTFAHLCGGHHHADDAP